MATPELAQEIQRLAENLPRPLLLQLAEVLHDAEAGNWAWLRLRLPEEVMHPANRERAGAFVTFWQAHAPDVAPQSVALALQVAAEVAEHHRQQQQVELVWTGPDSKVIPLRRTDQVLLQVIDAATQHLHIVSFAVYNTPTIRNALIEAVRRGVILSVYLETPDASEGKITYDTIGALGKDIQARSTIYVWPREKRPVADSGKHGSLHAKIALADNHTMLISSANLTGYAMTLNMEMGILVRGGQLPEQVEQHLRRLVEMGEFQRV